MRVTFDRYLPFKKQISLARKSQEDFPDMLLDFLIKPERRSAVDSIAGPLVDWHKLARLADKIDFPSVIGFTEKELGVSYKQRAETIMRIREALREHGIERPIHIFGCLDPFGVLLYVAAGADIFDGLTWLRFAWVDGGLGYIPTAVADGGRWRDNLEMATRSIQIGNLSELSSLQAAARCVARDHSFREVRPPWKRHEQAVRDVLQELDLSMEGS